MGGEALPRWERDRHSNEPNSVQRSQWQGSAQTWEGRGIICPGGVQRKAAGRPRGCASQRQRAPPAETKDGEESRAASAVCDFSTLMT